MKPRIGVYLSEQMAARLAAAAKRPGATKSALVEAALAQFLGSDDETDNIPVDRRLSLMSRQLEELDRGLRIVNETVALQARFHLAVTPVLPAADQRAACVLGSERFDEFAAQVGRRVRLGTSLMQETMDRLSTPKREVRSSVPLRGNVADMLLNSRARSPHVKPGWHRSRAIHCRPGGRQPVQLSREGRTASALDPLCSRQLLTKNLSNSHCGLHRPAMLLDADVSAA